MSCCDGPPVTDHVFAASDEVVMTNPPTYHCRICGKGKHLHTRHEPTVEERLARLERMVLK
jgi:hypothetical protein